MLTSIKEQTRIILKELNEQVSLGKRDLFVIGCSTSEVAGEKIGTSGALDVAEAIFSEIKAFQEQTGVSLAVQCCEHLNRALVVERETAEKYGLEQVSVVPVQQAGGSFATYTYDQMNDPIVVEFIKADVGMDIGDTFIGMHLKHVAVPLRASLRQIGEAHVTMAKTRPKLIGGERAVYEKNASNQSCR